MKSKATLKRARQLSKELQQDAQEMEELRTFERFYKLLSKAKPHQRCN